MRKQNEASSAIEGSSANGAVTYLDTGPQSSAHSVDVLALQLRQSRAAVVQARRYLRISRLLGRAGGPNERQRGAVAYDLREARRQQEYSRSSGESVSWKVAAKDRGAGRLKSDGRRQRIGLYEGGRAEFEARPEMR